MMEQNQNSTNPSTRVSRWIQKLKATKKPKKEKTTPKEQGLPEETEQISDAFQELDWDVTKNLSIIPYFGKVGDVFQKQGFMDGARGISGEGYYRLAKAKVQGLVDDLNGTLTAESARLRAELRGLKAIADSVGNEREQTERILIRKQVHPREYSVLLAIIYLTVAVILVLADIPLAVKLLTNGFDLTFGFPTMDALMRYPLATIQANWEPLIMALGIAFSSIFFKILYDDYLGGPLSRRATMLRREAEIDPKDAKEKETVLRSYRFRAWVKLSILMLTLTTIIIIGIFRAQAIQAEKKSAIPQASSSISVQPQNPSATLINSTVTQLTFILITLLFPIVSGVCLSLGLDRWLNYWELQRARLTVKSCRAKCIEAEKKLVSIEGRLSMINVNIEHVTSLSFFRKYLDHLLACYTIGYERGEVAPDSNIGVKGYFEMATRMRRKIMARQVFNSIESANQRPGGPVAERFRRMIDEDFSSSNNSPQNENSNEK